MTIPHCAKPAVPPKAKSPLRIVADEMIHGDLEAFLKKSGCDVIRTPKGYKNGRVYQFSKDGKRILLSQDKDFSDTNRYPPDDTEGIICLRVFPPTINNVISRMKNFIRETSPEKLKGKLTVLS